MTAEIERRRPAVSRRGEQPANAGVGREQAHAEMLERRHRQQADVRQRVVHARAPERPEHGQGRRPHRQGGEDRELGVRLVLVGPRSLDRHARGLQLGDAGLAERIAVPDPAIDDEAERAGMARTAIRRHDPGPGLQPAGPGRIEGRARTDLSVGEDDHLHGRMLTAARVAPM